MYKEQLVKCTSIRDYEEKWKTRMLEEEHEDDLLKKAIVLSFHCPRA